MSGMPKDLPQPQLTTDRAAGGRSARLVTVIVVLVLGGVAWVGFSGRQGTPPAATAGSPLPSLGRQPATPAPETPPLTVITEVAPPGASPVYDGYGVELLVDGRRYPAALYEVDGILTARYRVPASLARGEATLGLAGVISSFSHDIVSPIAQWTIPLAPPDSYALVFNIEGRAGGADQASAGFVLSVIYTPDLDGLTLSVEVIPHPPSVNPAPEYRYAISTEITGGTLRAPLMPGADGTQTVALVIDSVDVGRQIELAISYHPRGDGLQISEVFGAWQLPLRQLRRQDGIVELLVEHVPPDPTLQNATSPMRTGYTITVRGRQEEGRITLFVEFVPASPGS